VILDLLFHDDAQIIDGILSEIEIMILVQQFYLKMIFMIYIDIELMLHELFELNEITELE
jgi:hypothetical protein